METKTEILKKLGELKKELKRRYKIKEIGVFGSVIKEEQSESSDLDILVDFEEGTDLFDLVGLALFFEEKLKHPVDVVPKGALRKELKEAILKEVVYL